MRGMKIDFFDIFVSKKASVNADAHTPARRMLYESVLTRRCTRGAISKTGRKHIDSRASSVGFALCSQAAAESVAVFIAGIGELLRYLLHDDGGWRSMLILTLYINQHRRNDAC